MRVEIMEYAHIDCKNSILLSGGNENESTAIGCFGYLLLINDRYVLIDTGIESIDAVNNTKASKSSWERYTNEGNLPENLRKLGVNPKDITDVFITHTHYDHLSGIIHLPHAHLHISKLDYNFLKFGDHPHKDVLRDAIHAMEGMKITLIEKEQEFDGIRCNVVGGHTPGSMLVYADKYLFTGDAIFLLESIRQNIPIGFGTDNNKKSNALAMCQKFPGTVLTGHDFMCREMLRNI